MQFVYAYVILVFHECLNKARDLSIPRAVNSSLPFLTDVMIIYPYDKISVPEKQYSIAFCVFI